MRNYLAAGLSLLALSALTAPASATDFVVSAYSNSSSGGTGLTTVSLTAGESFSVHVDPNEIWSLGGLPRWSNADGLITDLFATGTDASGLPAGTQIGAVFPDWTENGLTAPYNSLVGSLNGVFFEIGTNFSGTAASTGTLYLYDWDENFADNGGTVTASITTGGGAPEPGAWALLLCGFLGLGLIIRYTRATTVSASV